jgi:hypothetical protein
MESRACVANLEVEPLPKCTVLDPAEVAGKFVRCYVCANSRQGTITRFRDDLDTHHLRLVMVDFCVADEDVEWENPDDPTTEELIQDAMATGGVVYGEFHVWDHDAPDASEKGTR